MTANSDGHIDESTPPEKKPLPLVAQTMLDMEACRQVISQLVSSKEVKVREQLNKGKEEAQKPATGIESYRPASPCASIWEKAGSKERYRLCSKCQLFIYDFTDMDLAESENLVFQREGKQRPIFFKRMDGKFLTSDCPVGMKRKRDLVVGIAVAVVLVFGLIAFALLMPPPPRAPEPTITRIEQPIAKPEISKSSSANQTTSKTSSGGKYWADPPKPRYLSAPAQSDATPQASQSSEVSPGYLTDPAASRNANPITGTNSTTNTIQTTNTSTIPATGENHTAVQTSPPDSSAPTATAPAAVSPSAPGSAPQEPTKSTDNPYVRNY